MNSASEFWIDHMLLGITKTGPTDSVWPGLCATFLVFEAGIPDLESSRRRGFFPGAGGQADGKEVLWASLVRCELIIALQGFTWTLLSATIQHRTGENWGEGGGQIRLFPLEWERSPSSPGTPKAGSLAAERKQTSLKERRWKVVDGTGLALHTKAPGSNPAISSERTLEDLQPTPWRATAATQSRCCWTGWPAILSLLLQRHFSHSGHQPTCVSGRGRKESCLGRLFI